MVRMVSLNAHLDDGVPPHDAVSFCRLDSSTPDHVSTCIVFCCISAVGTGDGSVKRHEVLTSSGNLNYISATLVA